MRRLAPLVVIAPLLMACSSSARYAREVEPRRADAVSIQRAPLNESVFAEDKAVISDEELAKILDAEVLIPEGSRIAVHRLGALPYQMLRTRQRFQFDVGMSRELFAKLKDLPTVRGVAMLPSLVVPQVLSIPHLRKAAARCQSELLLLYRVSSSSYEDRHVFRSDETYAFCMVEAMLVHTRSGLIIWSTQATEDFATEKSNQDLDFAETISNAQLTAFSKVMQQVGDELRARLEIDT